MSRRGRGEGAPLLPGNEGAISRTRDGFSHRPDFELAPGVRIGPGAQSRHFLRVIIKTCLLLSQALMFTSMAIDGGPAWLATSANWLLLVAAGLLAFDTAINGTGLPPLLRQIVDANGQRASYVPRPLRMPLSALFAFFATAGAFSLFMPEHVANAILPSAAVPLYTIFALMLPYVGNAAHANTIEMLQGGLLIAGASLGAGTFALHAYNNVAPDNNQLELSDVPASLMALAAAGSFSLATLNNLVPGLVALFAQPERLREALPQATSQPTSGRALQGPADAPEVSGGANGSSRAHSALFASQSPSDEGGGAETLPPSFAHGGSSEA